MEAPTPKRRRTQIADDSESESDHQEDESVGESETEPQTGAALVLDAAPLANEAGDDEAALDMADDPAPSEEEDGEDLLQNPEADYQRIEALDNYDEEMLDKREYRGMDQSTAAPTTQNTHAPTHPTAESQRVPPSPLRGRAERSFQ